MSRTLLRKESSYSEFRKQNSLSKSSLNYSMLDMDTSISIIADEKTSELLSMENELQSLVRNRSFSAKPSAKILVHQSLKLKLPVRLETPDRTLQNINKNPIQSDDKNQNPPKTNRSIHYQSFTQPFQIIQQSQFYNQQDNAILQDKQQKNKITTKPQNKNEKNPIQKRKDSFQLTKPVKTQSKATIKDLEQMEKRLQSVKKAKKFVGRDVNPKKTEIITKKPNQMGQRRIHKTASDAHLTTENGRLKGIDIMRQKQLALKSKMTKKFSLADSVKPTPQSEGVLIPTKMVNLQQKQKLLKQFDKIKQSIKNTDISAENIATIKSMLKTMQGLIN